MAACCTVVNRMKSNMSRDVFLKVAVEIVNHCLKKGYILASDIIK